MLFYESQILKALPIALASYSTNMPTEVNSITLRMKHQYCVTTDRII